MVRQSRQRAEQRQAREANQPILWEPLARTTDPATSHQAAADVELPKLQRAMLLAFKPGPKTSRGAARYCIANGGQHDTESYRKRTAELVRKRVIEHVSTRACGVTGKQARVFKAFT